MPTQYLYIDTPKELTFTLYAKSSNITNPYFIFTLKNKESLECHTFSCESDISIAPYYYNTFTFSISSTMSGLTSGIVQADTGHYEYNAYETNYQYDLNIASASNIVDNGLIVIVATASPYPTNTDSDDNTIPINKNLNYL